MLENVKNILQNVLAGIIVTVIYWHIENNISTFISNQILKSLFRISLFILLITLFIRFYLYVKKSKSKPDWESYLIILFMSGFISLLIIYPYFTRLEIIKETQERLNVFNEEVKFFFEAIPIYCILDNEINYIITNDQTNKSRFNLVSDLNTEISIIKEISLNLSAYDKKSNQLMESIDSLTNYWAIKKRSFIIENDSLDFVLELNSDNEFDIRYKKIINQYEKYLIKDSIDKLQKVYNDIDNIFRNEKRTHTAMKLRIEFLVGDDIVNGAFIAALESIKEQNENFSNHNFIKCYSNILNRLELNSYLKEESD